MPLLTQKNRLTALAVLAILAGGFLGQLPYAYASSWSPTLLVNTEAFQVIDDTDSTADLYIQFGDSLNKRLTYDRTVGTFIFDDDLEVIGTASGRQLHAQDLFTSSGQIIIEGNEAFDPALLYVDQNSTTGSGQLIDSESQNQAGLIIDMPEIRYDNGSGGALNPHILFGYDDLFDTNLYRQSGNILKTDDSFWIKETVSGATIRSFGLADCDNATDDKLLWDETTGTFSCGTDQSGGGGFSGTGSLQNFFDDRYVNTSGDTMTGSLTIDNEGSGLDLNIRGTASGEHLHFGRLLSGSGNLVIDGTAIFNQDGDADNFRIESDNEENMFFVHGANDRVGIGTSSPGAELDVIGTISGSSLNVGDINGSLAVNTGSIMISRDEGPPEWKTPTSGMMWYIDGTLSTGTDQSAIVIMPFGMTLTDVDLKVKTAPTDSAIIIDINEEGTTLFSTNPEIDAGTTREDNNHVFSDTTLAVGSEITIDIDQVGSGTAGSSISIILKGTRHY